MVRAFKVVIRENDLFVSAAAKGTYKLRYRLGKVTSPKVEGSKIFVFKSFDRARRYATEFWNAKVLEGFAENPVLADFKYLPFADELRIFREFWRDPKAMERGCLFKGESKGKVRNRTPSRTFICDSFTPTKDRRR